MHHRGHEGNERDQGGAGVQDHRHLVVANLPYYIASPTARLFLESTHRPRRMVVTVQREVALEMTALNNTYVTNQKIKMKAFLQLVAEYF